MKPLKPDAYQLLRIIIQLTPYTTRVIQQTGLRDVNKWKKFLQRKGLIILTGEDGQWERMFPTEEGKLFQEWQSPLMRAKPGKEPQETA